MDLALFERVQRAVKIVISGVAAIIVVMVIVAVVTSSLRPRLNDDGDDNRRQPATATAAVLRGPAPRASAAALPVEPTRKRSGDQLRSEIVNATTTLLRAQGINADASTAGDTLVISASSGCDRDALIGIRASLTSIGFELSDGFAAIRCFGSAELKLK